MKLDSRIFVAGHCGLVGAALVRALEAKGHTGLILRSRAELDLRDAVKTRAFFESERPEYVFLAAARVGGIQANLDWPAEFIADNLAIHLNTIDSAYRCGTQKFVFLGSSAAYPKECPQPIREEYLLTGPLDFAHEPYAVAKIAGVKMCEAYRRQYGFQAMALMPTNLYGPGDHFDTQAGHVLPAMIRRFHQAKVDGAAEVVVWGSGTPRREFLHCDDLAEAILYLCGLDEEIGLLNVGCGSDVSIAELAATIREVVGFEGDLTFDRTKPDGTMRKLMDVSKLNALGWQAKRPLFEGIRETYAWYLESGLAG